MSEDEKLKIGKRIIFSLCDKTPAPLGVRRCRGAFKKEMKTLLEGWGVGGITCISSEPLLITQRGPSVLAPTQPHAQNRLIMTSI